MLGEGGGGTCISTQNSHLSAEISISAQSSRKSVGGKAVEVA